MQEKSTFLKLLAKVVGDHYRTEGIGTIEEVIGARVCRTLSAQIKVQVERLKNYSCLGEFDTMCGDWISWATRGVSVASLKLPGCSKRDPEYIPSVTEIPLFKFSARAPRVLFIL